MKSSKELTWASDPRLALIGGEGSQTTYLSFPSAGKVPLSTELASASNVGDGEDPLTFLDEFQYVSAEEGVDGDIETSVSCEPSGPQSAHESQKGRR